MTHRTQIVTHRTQIVTIINTNMSIKNLNKFIQLRDALLEVNIELSFTRHKLKRAKENRTRLNELSVLTISNWEDKITQYKNRMTILKKCRESLKTVLKDMHPRIRMKSRPRRSLEEIEFCERSEPNDKKYKF